MCVDPVRCTMRVSVVFSEERIRILISTELVFFVFLCFFLSAILLCFAYPYLNVSSLENDSTTGGRKGNLLRTINSPGRSYESRYEKKMKSKLDDEIKLAVLQSLVPEELEKHLILNSNRLRTFEDARLEVVTHVETKFCLRIRDSKPSDTGARGHSHPMDVDAIGSPSSGKGKGSSSPRDGCF